MSATGERAAEWVYRDIWAVLVNWFRVPQEPPSLPATPTGKPESFHPALGFLRYLKFWFWFVAIAIDIALACAYLAIAAVLIDNDLTWVAVLLLPIALVIIVVPDILIYVAIHLRYDTTWYVMSERSLRIRRGIWIIQETTITFENVQNMKIRQGPIQRYFGVANLIVETAGAGGDSSNKKMSVANQGIVEGISNAWELRDRILPHLQQSRSAGLGDDTDTDDRKAGFGPQHLLVLREIRDEIAALASDN